MVDESMTTSTAKKTTQEKWAPKAPKLISCETWGQVKAAINEVEMNNAKIARMDDGHWRLEEYVLEL